jgi:hypothetical protein
MRFNAGSVLLNAGIERYFDVYVPRTLVGYCIPTSVWDVAIKTFNKKLDDRKQVQEVVAGIEMDILRFGLEGGTFYIRTYLREFDAEKADKTIEFTFSGEVVMAEKSKRVVDMIIIEDLAYKLKGDTVEWSGILKKS